MSNVRKFLDIDPDYQQKVYKRGTPEESEDENDICLNFTKQGQSDIQNIKIKEIERRLFEFTYFDIVNEADVANEVTIEVRAGDLKVM